MNTYLTFDAIDKLRTSTGNRMFVWKVNVSGTEAWELSKNCFATPEDVLKIASVKESDSSAIMTLRMMPQNSKILSDIFETKRKSDFEVVRDYLNEINPNFASNGQFVDISVNPAEALRNYVAYCRGSNYADLYIFETSAGTIVSERHTQLSYPGAQFTPRIAAMLHAGFITIVIGFYKTTDIQIIRQNIVTGDIYQYTVAMYPGDTNSLLFNLDDGIDPNIAIYPQVGSNDFFMVLQSARTTLVSTKVYNMREAKNFVYNMVPMNFVNSVWVDKNLRPAASRIVPFMTLGDNIESGMNRPRDISELAKVHLEFDGSKIIACICDTFKTDSCSRITFDFNLPAESRNHRFQISELIFSNFDDAKISVTTAGICVIKGKYVIALLSDCIEAYESENLINCRLHVFESIENLTDAQVIRGTEGVMVIGKTDTWNRLKHVFTKYGSPDGFSDANYNPNHLLDNDSTYLGNPTFGTEEITTTMPLGTLPEIEVSVDIERTGSVTIDTSSEKSAGIRVTSENYDSVAIGDSVIVSCIVNEPYIFDHWEDADGKELSVSETIQFNVFTENVTLIPVTRKVEPEDEPTIIPTLPPTLPPTEVPKCTLTLLKTVGINSVSALPAGPYDPGTKIVIQARIASGYKFAGWFREGQKISNNPQFEYVMPESDVTLQATVTTSI